MSEKGVNVAFFSRGRGLGHAVPDMAIWEEIQRAHPDWRVHWVSYGSGAEALRSRGYNVIDLRLPEANPFLETQMRALGAIASVRPSVVVAHEEFAAIPAAHILKIPSIAVTDYFVHPHHIWMQALLYCQEIIFLDREGIFEVPTGLKEKVRYAGAFVRPMSYGPDDRERARAELSIPPDCKLVLVLPSGWYTEQRAPIVDTVLPAFEALGFREKLLVWFAGRDVEQISAAARSIPQVVVNGSDVTIERWMIASDLAITKGTRKTSLELEHLRVRSVSLSDNSNLIDETRIRRIASNAYLSRRDTSADRLSRVLGELLAAPPLPAEIPDATGFNNAVRWICDRIMAENLR